MTNEAKNLESTTDLAGLAEFALLDCPCGRTPEQLIVNPIDGTNKAVVVPVCDCGCRWSILILTNGTKTAAELMDKARYFWNEAPR